MIKEKIKLKRVFSVRTYYLPSSNFRYIGIADINDMATVLYAKLLILGKYTCYFFFYLIMYIKLALTCKIFN